MNKHVIVLSHRRSGTHLTIDSIYNNFKELRQKPYINLDKTRYYIKAPVDLDTFKKQLGDKPRIIKSHYLPDFSNYYKTQKEINWVEQLFMNSHLIYIYRNGLDVMVSLYEYLRSFNPEYQGITFSDFLLSKNHFEPGINQLNRMEYWAYHIEQWHRSRYKNQIFFLKYEDIIKNYQDHIGIIAKYIHSKPGRHFKDVRMKKKSAPITRAFITFHKRLKGIKKTSVSARKGKIGDSKNYFSEEDRKRFFQYNKDIINKLGY